MTQPMEPSTKERILQFIEAYKKKNGYVPMQITIARGLKPAITRQAVRYHFETMPEIAAKYPEYQRYAYNQPKKEGTPHVQHPNAN